MVADNVIQVGIQPGDTPMVAGGAKELFLRQNGLRANEGWMHDFRLFSHQHHVPLPLHGGSKRLVSFRLARNLEKCIHYDHCTAVIGKFVQQLGVQGAIPRLAARLVELIERGVIHENQSDIVRGNTGVEAEEIIVTCVHPSITEMRSPQQPTAKQRQACAHDADA